MKVNVENQKSSQKIIKIEVDTERVNAALEDVYGSIQKKAHVPGYRPGKAPRDMVKARYDKTANEETINRLVWECYHEALKEKGISPLGYPVIVDMNFNEGKPLKFSVKVDVRPDFKLKSYKGIKVKEKPCDVTDADVDNSLEQLRESLAEYKNIAPRPIEKGDYVVCEYECYAEGKLVDKNEKLWLYISDQLQPKELLELLLGAEQSALKETEVSYPQDYEYKELAGKKRLYKVTPKEIKQKLLPEVNDDLAKSTGHFKDLSELKSDLKSNILKNKQLESKRDIENQVYSFLLKNHAFEVPASLVERQSLQLVEEAKKRLLQQGYKKEDIEKQDAKLKESVKDKASDNVKLFFILEKIAREENIRADEKDLEKKVSEIAKYAKQDAAKVREHIEKNNLTENLKEQILHDKVAEFLLAESKKT